ncbi:venom acid phosphatase Acph-1-like [Cylas formicarius]|uniref:venom acid phosphatase Acph-1-like n=1 Tax=Cylas formicarius TaxID=197179 RepID=UPI002958A146|nr:venom acid phosphatase Acph-1-like [Cylas formicarius]XP_060531080.1 venom acid phosphatase Acph-1-like [Cylas formicarius]
MRFAVGLILAISSVQLTYEETSVDAGSETLILTHVLFRHGNRTADRQHELYPNDPYLNEDYYPYGNGQLTKAGKQKEYSIGKALRARYHDFLGDDYYPDIIEAFSTDYNRTKMSLQLVLAGLFPPNEEDMFEYGIQWQPVPFNYLPKDQDKILLGVLCPRYLALYDEVSQSPEMLKEFGKYRDVFRYISENTGLNVRKFFDVYNLYFGLSTEEEWGFDLPQWTKTVWPTTITSLAIKEYFVSMATLEMRQMATGYFLNKLIEDTKRKIISSNLPGKKMFLYSAHESNLAELLMALNVFTPHVPNYGAWISIEVHFINNIYGVKVFYENHEEQGPRSLSLPNCGTFCPLDKFIQATAHLIPPEDMCGNL